MRLQEGEKREAGSEATDFPTDFSERTSREDEGPFPNEPWTGRNDGLGEGKEVELTPKSDEMDVWRKGTGQYSRGRGAFIQWIWHDGLLEQLLTYSAYIVFWMGEMLKCLPLGSILRGDCVCERLDCL